MQLTPSKLRTNLYNFLDEVIGGKTLQIKRKGKIIYIASEKKSSRLKNIVAKKVINDDESLQVDWEKEWNPYI